MACNGCGGSAPMTKENVENLINKLIDEGKLAGAMKDCEGNDLTKGTKVVLCSAFADMVQDLIDKGKVKTVADVKVSDGKLVVVDGTGKETEIATPFVSDLAFDSSKNKLTWVQDGKDKEASLPYIKAVMGDKSVTLTLPDGSTVEVPKGSSALTEDSFDHTIAKGANVPDKFGVKLKDKGGLKADGIGGVEVATGAGLEKDAQGNVTIKTGTGVKTNPDGSLSLDDNGAKDVVGAGLAGSGLTYDANAKTINVATIGLYDASGTVKLGELVNTGA